MMKKKWYRSGWMKGILLAVVVASFVGAVWAGVFVLRLYAAGVRFLEDKKGTEYVDSSGFAETVEAASGEILQGISARQRLDGSRGEVVDLREIYEGSAFTYRNTSGLAYAVEDLEKWADSWTYDNEEKVIVCEREDGSYAYFYFEDFSQKVAEGKLKFEFSEDMYALFPEAAREDDAEDDVVSQIMAELYNDSLDLTVEVVKAVRDTEKNTVYTDFWPYELFIIQEKYPPQGAESILDAVTKSSVWNGHLSEAYEMLRQALDWAASQAETGKMLNDYREGNTNLTYYYADRENRKVYTNRKEYENGGQYEDVFKKIENGDDPYACFAPTLADSRTNINFDLSVWHHTVCAGREEEDFLFAVQVDSAFPVADTFARASENYGTYAKWGPPALMMCIFAGLFFFFGLCCLTLAAGRRPEDEELHLCWFDRWYTEIAAAAVFLLGGLVLAAWLWGLERLFYITGQWTFRVEILITAFFMAVIFLAGYLSLARRIKARNLWKKSLTREIVLLLGKMWKYFLRFCKKLYEILSDNLPGRLKTLAIVCGFFLLQIILSALLFAVGGGFFAFLLLVLADGAALLYCLKKAYGQEQILKGLQRIADGELQYKIPQKYLTGEQKKTAEYIGRIGEGLDAAVESSLKNERMKTELITNVSHDLKTPLTSIINYVDLLKRENFEDPRIRGYIEVLEAKAQRLKSLTEDVVEASKASTGNITLEMADLNFPEMVKQVTGEFEEKFRARSLEMIIKMEQEPVVIRADGQRLWRVLENIFNNAVKYAMEGTRVYVELKARQGAACFTLKNISAQPLDISADELTERFIRGDMSRNTEGSGLGLSIAKSLTELMGGRFLLYLDGDFFRVTIEFDKK